ncbi:hypothetical protein [uncultured Clostridium sp.]|uniref:hypothetical protein n=1 Tax=uncultured Clostridium sp. TaxID=59620 RepID=UPI0026F37E40|nr:hypothetical protein [uncultured Clostridium sp.]
MEIRLEINKEELKCEVGDAIVLSTGDVFILCHDYDEADVRGFNLKTMVSTEYYTNITRLVEDIEEEYHGKVTRVIKAEHLYMGVK